MKNLLTIIMIILIIISIITIFIFRPGISPVLESIYFVEQKTAIMPYIYDIGNDEPLENAIIVLPQTGKQYITSSNGYPETEIEIDFVKRNEYSGNNGEITILVYHPNFRPLAIFYVETTKNQLRQGPSIAMIRNSETSENSPVLFIESPNKEWAENLVMEFMPQP